ncbi:hypothetical protein D5I55_17440 [Chakrabartia godavariana]|nr:hypothetical protein D5I55_17440 [Chakrabartia godavariana]
MSVDGDQGFPGEMVARVTYSWSDDYCLDIDYAAMTTAATPVNLTQHSYFNLSGVSRKAAPILDHLLTIHASHYLPVDEALLPLGLLQAVKGRAFDFSQPKRMGRDIDADDAQLRLAGGYDNDWALAGEGFRLGAELSHPLSGRSIGPTGPIIRASRIRCFGPVTPSAAGRAMAFPPEAPDGASARPDHPGTLPPRAPVTRPQGAADSLDAR